MAVLMRGGVYADFDPAKLRPREWAVVLSGDPGARDGHTVYLCFGGGKVKRMATYEDANDIIFNATADIRHEYATEFDEIKAAIIGIRDQAITSATQAAQAVTAAAEIRDSAAVSQQQAAVSATEASAHAAQSNTYALQSKSYAVGTDGAVREGDAADNAKWYYDQARRISQGLNGIYAPMGTIPFANIPLTGNVPGQSYNISDAFVSDDRFKDGGGIKYPLGTNIIFTEDEFWDCLTGVMVTGVKGAAETEYHVGDINITPEMIGAMPAGGGTSDMTVTFTQAAERANISPGDSLAVAFGKLSKYCADLKAVAFSGNYNDLSNRPTIPTIPASLPANGGNADTVDGKHASDLLNYNNLTNKPAVSTVLWEWLKDSSGTYTFVKGADGKWVSNNANVHNSVATSSWHIDVDASAQAEIKYGVSSEANYDKLTLKIRSEPNGGTASETTIANGISGTQDSTYTASLTPGRHIITAEYRKDGSTNSGSDQAYITFPGQGSGTNIVASVSNDANSVVKRASDKSIFVGRVSSEAPEEASTYPNYTIVNNGYDGILRKMPTVNYKKSMGSLTTDSDTTWVIGDYSSFWTELDRASLSGGYNDSLNAIGDIHFAVDYTTINSYKGSVLLRAAYTDVLKISSTKIEALKPLTVGGSKSRQVDTPNYGERLLYCYEMPSPMFGDIGEGVTDGSGECRIFLDDIFSETVTANIEYQVFIQKEGEGDVWIAEKNPIYFLVKGTANLKFAWEVKVKQKDYEFERLETDTGISPVQSESEQVLNNILHETSDYMKKQEEQLYEAAQ